MILNSDNSNFKKNLYGLDKYFLDLIKLFDLGKLPKVLMLSGKKGQGKFTLTHHLMSYIFDKKNYDKNNLSINAENKVYVNVKNNYHPGIIYYDCIDKNTKLDTIRKLRTDLQKTSINNSYRFIIFDDVECLNENCINALLKTIEEPSDTNFFILINNQSDKILETIKSRSIEILIFLNSNQKMDITRKLISDFGIDENVDLINTTLTPGNYLKYVKFITEDKIDVNDELILNIEKLFKLNKIKKNIDYLNFAIYLINKYYYDISRGKSNIDNFNDKRVNLIKKIQESNKLNLNYKNLIIEIENHI